MITIKNNCYKKRKPGKEEGCELSFIGPHIKFPRYLYSWKRKKVNSRV